jgi:hypothetical protein
MTMTKEERAMIIFELRMRGVHPSFINYWLKHFPNTLIELHKRNWFSVSGAPWEPQDNWKKPKQP